MTTITQQQLKDNRNTIINLLVAEFQFKVYELKNLMTDYIAFLEADGWDGQLTDIYMIKKSVRDFFIEKSDNYSSDRVASQNYSNELLQQSKQLI